MMTKFVVELLVVLSIIQHSACVVVNEKVELKTMRQDKLALNLNTYVDKKGIEAVGNETIVRNLTSEVHRIVRTIFASVGYNVMSSPFSESIDVFTQTSVERYLHEFDVLVSESGQIKYQQQTLILFTGHKWPGTYK